MADMNAPQKSPAKGGNVSPTLINTRKITAAMLKAMNVHVLRRRRRRRAPKLFPRHRIVCIVCRQLLCSFNTSLIIRSECEMLLALNFHLEGLCQATGHDASRCSASPGKIIKRSQLLPQGQFSHRADGERRTAHRGAGFYVNEQRESPFSSSPLSLNPIMCHHASPTRLFPSYQQRRLPILLNCLLCKVTAEERR
ncbi:unnamed protein product [Pleuronectes platessa]|uniref:Uncharacterized protein n=1 Tax=Pleuronectes platessa TaxID=8262 RepID=A0A9N7YCA2_PLEPL|nr:unnamed protein product [Pleuronectes platessa]